MQRKITSDRDGLSLVGNLFTPEGFDESARYDTVIVQGSLTSVKEQMPGTYAQAFAAQGFVALAFDCDGSGRVRWSRSDAAPAQSSRRRRRAD